MLNHNLEESDPKQTQMWAKTSFYCGGEVLNLFSTAVSFLSLIAAPPEPKRSSDGGQKESGYLPMDSGLSNYCILLSFNIKESEDFTLDLLLQLIFWVILLVLTLSYVLFEFSSFILTASFSIKYLKGIITLYSYISHFEYTAYE